MLICIKSFYQQNSTGSYTCNFQTKRNRFEKLLLKITCTNLPYFNEHRSMNTSQTFENIAISLHWHSFHRAVRDSNNIYQMTNERPIKTVQLK